MIPKDTQLFPEKSEQGFHMGAVRPKLEDGRVLTGGVLETLPGRSERGKRRRRNKSFRKH